MTSTCLPSNVRSNNSAAASRDRHVIQTRRLRYPRQWMTSTVKLPRPACATAQIGQVAVLLAALTHCADNPAFKSSGEPVTTTDATTDTTTGEPDAPCPGDQPFGKYWPDADKDGYGYDNSMQIAPTLACEPPEGMVDLPGDCNDETPEVRPMVIEQCNGFDDNCNAIVDEGSALCGACTVVPTESFIYWICPEKQPITWQAASDRCEALSFKNPVRLASVHDKAEHDFLKSHLGKFDAVANEKHVWLGLKKRSGPDLSCDVPTPGDDWVWQDGSEVDFTDWLPGQPDNKSCVLPDTLENCGELTLILPSELGWSDVDCAAPGRGYVCKAARDKVLMP